MFKAQIIAHSASPSGQELITGLLTYPRFIHAEVMTYRMFSRNAASSRAIPSKKMRRNIRKQMAEPVEWGQNCKGMHAKTELSGWRRNACRAVWLGLGHINLFGSYLLDTLGAHKQVTNRVTEPWMFITTIVTANREAWEHMLAQRLATDAQPEFRTLARLVKQAICTSVPHHLREGEWHMPFSNEELGLTEAALNELPPTESKLMARVKICIARCARLSYLTFDGVFSIVADLNLCEKLIADGHQSPLEHVAQAMGGDDVHGNLRGFRSYRVLHADMERIRAEGEPAMRDALTLTTPLPRLLAPPDNDPQRQALALVQQAPTVLPRLH